MKEQGKQVVAKAVLKQLQMLNKQLKFCLES